MTNDQHARPLWIGMIACALFPTLVIEVLFQFSAEKNMMMVPDLLVVIIALPVSLFAVVSVALPYTLWLRRLGKLNAIRLCIAGALVGAAALAVLNFYTNYYPEMNDQKFMIQTALKSALASTVPGAIIGFLSSVALCVGAGITIRSSRSKNATRPGSA